MTDETQPTTDDLLKAVLESMGNLGDRMDRLDERMGQIEGRMASMESRLGTIEVRMSTLEDSVKTIRQTMTDDFRPKIDTMAADMRRINQQLSGVGAAAIRAITT